MLARFFVERDPLANLFLVLPMLVFGEDQSVCRRFVQYRESNRRTNVVNGLCRIIGQIKAEADSLMAVGVVRLQNRIVPVFAEAD